MSKRPKKASEGYDEAVRSEDGHILIGNARWHYPIKGDPETCAVPGCDRVLGQMDVEAFDEDEDGGPDSESSPPDEA